MNGCVACGEVDVPVAAIVAFDRAVAEDLARRGPVSGESFRFIRKAVPLQPIELARMLGVTVDTVNRWEAGRREMDLAAWLVVATIALETFGSSAPIVRRIEALRRPVDAERVLDLGSRKGHWGDSAVLPPSLASMRS